MSKYVRSYLRYEILTRAENNNDFFRYSTIARHVMSHRLRVACERARFYVQKLRPISLRRL